MIYIYVLQLKYKKYYIGKTNNPNFRLKQHFNSNGSAWTKKYKPINIIEVIPNCDLFDEDKYTIKYMAKYGINNVRGGSFCELKLSPNNISTIQKMITSSNDKCYKCHRKGHYEKNCFASIYNNGNVINDDTYSNIDEYELVEVWSCNYCNKEFGSLKGSTYHENFYCKKNKSFDNNRKIIIDNIKSNSIADQKYEQLNNQPYQIKVLYEISKHLLKNENIIKKAFEHDGKIGCYNVCYITNIGRILYSSYNQKYNRFNGPIKKLECNDNKVLDELFISNIINHDFKADHYSKLKIELIEYLNLMISILQSK